jgi:hypothetical protein
MTARRVTRDVAPERLRELLDRPPRATVAFVRAGVADLLPARAHARRRHLFAVPDAAPAFDGQGGRAARRRRPVLVPARGVSVRGGIVARRRAAADEAPGLAWYAVDARRVLAWDYGAIREE